MDLTMITAAYEGLKFAKDALKVALDYKIENESRTQINAALEKLGSAQDSLFELREELFRLQTENERLRQELKLRDDWEAQKAQYELVEASGGAVVYAYRGTPKHFACPACFAKMTIQILQDRRVVSGGFDCPSCKMIYSIKPAQKIPVRGPSYSRDPQF